MIYAEIIVAGLNRFYRGYFQNTPNIKTIFGYATLIVARISCNFFSYSVIDFPNIVVGFCTFIENQYFCFISVYLQVPCFSIVSSSIDLLLQIICQKMEENSEKSSRNKVHAAVYPFIC